jgi:hypothetical protein
MFGLFCFGELKPVLTYVNYVPFIVCIVKFTYVGDMFYEPKFSLRPALRSAV